MRLKEQRRHHLQSGSRRSSPASLSPTNPRGRSQRARPFPGDPSSSGSGDEWIFFSDTLPCDLILILDEL
ncbi:mannose-6-phosphate isomerase 1-like isoform X1 [Iris pallida]|uniref:Mannose-6-phosphate isomerase 1-like isoform X1 n=1 Tax=Iris pallida TaxID=29817 RepID=A0AAX6GUE1_IRIPA|nr:mannose-6-phosphate isomerase 1-like isoform X1 [Iris pallida]